MFNFFKKMFIELLIFSGSLETKYKTRPLLID